MQWVSVICKLIAIEQLHLELSILDVCHLVEVLRRPVMTPVSLRNPHMSDIHVLTMPIFSSTVMMRLFASFFNSLDVTSFSNARTTPSLHLMPTDVPPFSTAFTAYSTWKLRPSGEKMEFDRS